jgi:hypothetical protein
VSAVTPARPTVTPEASAPARPGRQNGAGAGQSPFPASPARPGGRAPLAPQPEGPEGFRRPRPRPAPRRSANPAVSVIVPTRNEARNLEIVLPAIAAVRPAVHEVIVVDGNSTDNTVAVARRTLPWARVITQTRKGKGNAMACGFTAATGDVIVMFDADGSADPNEIPAFVNALVKGADFAKGSRFCKGGGSDDITLLRKSGNAGLNTVANRLFGTRYSDLCYGYNAFRARALPQLSLDRDGFEIETLLNIRALRAGLRVVEVPSFEARRVHGEGRLRTIPDGWRVLCTIWREWRAAQREGLFAPAPAAPRTAPRRVARVEQVGPLAEV